MTPEQRTEELKESLILYPDIIAGNSARLIGLLNEKKDIDMRIDATEISVKFQVGTDPNLKNDTARKAAIQDMLNQNKQYDLDCRERDAKSLSIANTQIDHQRNRDMFHALIAIAGME
jgi:hypothetical protein